MEDNLSTVFFMALSVQAFLYLFGPLQSILMLYIGSLIMIFFSRIPTEYISDRLDHEEKVPMQSFIPVDNAKSLPTLVQTKSDQRNSCHHDGKNKEDDFLERCISSDRIENSEQVMVDQGSLHESLAVPEPKHIFQDVHYFDGSLSCQEGKNSLHEMNRIDLYDDNSQIQYGRCPNSLTDTEQHELDFISDQKNRISLHVYSNFLKCKQSCVTFDRKLAIKDQLVDIISDKLGRPISLHILGSSMNGFGSDDCGLDLCLTQEEFCEKLTKETILTDVQNIIAREKSLPVSGIAMIDFSFQFPALDFMFDSIQVSVFHRRTTLWTTELLTTFSELSPCISPLIWAVKSWATSQEISGRNGTLTGYCWTLLVIFYLQIFLDFPSLNTLAQIDNDTANLHIDESYLDQMFRDFFHFYSENSSSMATNKISVWEGQWIPEDHGYAIYVEEPCEKTNVAHGNDNESLFKLDRVFDKINQTRQSHVFH